MMLRKRSRSQGTMGHSDQSDLLLCRKVNNSNNFNVPCGVFVGLKGGSESDSVISPTSPLDFRVFSNLGNPFRSSSPSNGPHNSWACPKVGLGILDSLDNQMNLPHSYPSTKNILFGTQMRIKTQNEEPKSLPKNFSNLQTVVFGIGDAPSDHDSGRFISHSMPFGSAVGHASCVSKSVGSSTCLAGSVSASDIELSEDYTCVRTHGPNAKVTHIFGDCILECHNNEFTNFCKNTNKNTAMPHNSDLILTSYPSSDFLRYCHSCKKKLDGEDIYMYRGEKAFCSFECRSEVILIDEEANRISKNTNSH